MNASRARLVLILIVVLISAALMYVLLTQRGEFRINQSIAEVRLEAEDGILSGNANVEHDESSTSKAEGYSGRGYVAIRNEGTITLTHHASRAGLYEAILGYNAANGPKNTFLTVNGVNTAEVTLKHDVAEGYQGFEEISIGNVFLHEGENTIVVNKGWGWFNLDYIILRPSTVKDGDHRVEKNLSNPNASREARALMNYLVDTYGKGIISGQTELINAAWIYSKTGKFPAILGLDMMDYSPTRVENGTKGKAVDEALEWGAKNGIVTIHWHWNAPKDLINHSEHPWWRGFYADATTYDFAYALANPDSEDYRVLIRDIDVISEQLKRLRDAKIPVLWRPLHEADGGWFWWGAKGPEPYKKLYRLLYDRMTNHHGLNNLIWVWNSEEPDWYPGDDVVDILSTDYYAPPGDYNPLSVKYEHLVQLRDDTKMVALAENGPIPDPDLLQAYRANWLYFVTWTGDYIQDGISNTPEHLQKVYGSDYVITRDKLPDNLYSYGLPDPTA
ncbi:beta-mannanase [Thermobacillus composti KWC4]|jgi:mannan endo-1,4-beta-mannosidase|uniref:Beta-mannanase n=1 Tax=Thermobacillus composti (strain DSM 18247 / JCM 13945 / KWC4) TaxID=717605 RepID=L0EFI3_THECK|nr:glycosyl hydrolase [Thermobacillus composti]AGA58379.1 beta-mannanase [Thermobacillus composti KWC4]